MSEKASTVSILPCSCKNSFQDERYGKGLRVHNHGKVKGNAKGVSYICTGCATRKSAA